ncbi:MULTISPECIES: 3-hydroxyisobutyrate dehydrogenase [unclassified Variovorax]|uniref:3-hydroxyisobutyrate dehydrogenase n=1 Tax=unclassified Variovorax TaxID=663243 RepID=UPI00076C1D95|nr:MULTISPECIES: 3-hydroxyisobutyrate dehydrogenase [unclassified Variovorax]KWT97685.1 2-hydroxy-3-oxopropionate reductase [Variovorax sp. WDL1]PNG48784.1 3-hydroxyisobutyrate dehydrogenase [Variovorax sp. B2]PNG49291.1 3-hydroxyisobutyrate dehydrogenase [Variovorax sp. B4]VTV18437.1 3-hydroxyisobutyrate dehydrogenase [Variovorax sp. WDL1]
MANIGFIGLGAMGLPMAENLLNKGHVVCGFDLSQKSLARFASHGGTVATGIADLMARSEIIFTMLPNGPIVVGMFEAPDGIIANATKSHILIDCSTTGVPSARRLHAMAQAKGVRMLDAPVSGGVGGAEAGSLAIMVGGDAEVFALVKPVLEGIGRNLVLAGPAGAGQAAKICNNMAAGIIKIAISEAFVLARKLGVEDKVFFDIASSGSAQSFALTKSCPVPGLVATSPSSRNYSNGFATKLMLKDMVLAQEAAMEAGAATVLGGAATHLFQLCANAGHGDQDNGIVYQFLLNQQPAR